MTEEKRNRLIAAVTVNVILLIVILAIVCITQIVEMVTYKKLIKDMEERKDYYLSEENRAEETLDYYKSEEGLLDKAYEFGYVYGK